MARNRSKSINKLDQGRQLARFLFDRKLVELQNITAEERSTFLKEYPLLGEGEFEDVRRQVIQAKTQQQALVGWQVLPHDISVLVLVIFTGLFWDVRIGIIAYIAVLVLTESIFQVTYSEKIYRPLSILGWLTYLAYIAFAVILYLQGYAWYWIILAVAIAWGGTFLLGALARIPMRLWIQAKREAMLKRQQAQEKK